MVTRACSKVLLLGMSDGEVASELEAFPEIGVPQLVASGEGLEGSLVDCEALLGRRFGEGYQVSPP